MERLRVITSRFLFVGGARWCGARTLAVRQSGRRARLRIARGRCRAGGAGFGRSDQAPARLRLRAQCEERVSARAGRVRACRADGESSVGSEGARFGDRRDPGWSFARVAREIVPSRSCGKASQISEEIGDKDGMAFAFSQLGRVRNMQARYDEARDFHTRSFELWNELGDRRGVAVALNNVGAMYRAVGDYLTALDYYQRSLDALEQLGDRRGSSTVLDNMGISSPDPGRLREGSHARAQGPRNPRGAERSPGHFPQHEFAGDAVPGGGQLRRSARGGAQEPRHPPIARCGACDSGGAQQRRARSTRRRATTRRRSGYLTRALAVNEQVGSQSLLAEIHTHLGELFYLQGRDAEALKSLKRGLAISQPAGYKSQAAEGLYALGRLYLKQGRTASAAEALQQCSRAS